MCVYRYTCLCIYIHISIYTCICIYTYVYVYIYTHTYTYTYVYLYIHMCICIHTYLYYYYQYFCYLIDCLLANHTDHYHWGVQIGDTPKNPGINPDDSQQEHSPTTTIETSCLECLCVMALFLLVKHVVVILSLFDFLAI